MTWLFVPTFSALCKPINLFQKEDTRRLLVLPKGVEIEVGMQDANAVDFKGLREISKKINRCIITNTDCKALSISILCSGIISIAMAK